MLLEFLRQIKEKEEEEEENKENKDENEDSKKEGEELEETEKQPEEEVYKFNVQEVAVPLVVVKEVQHQKRKTLSNLFKY